MYVGIARVMAVGHPQVVGKTDLSLLAITGAAAAGRIDRLVHRIDDLGHENFVTAAAQPVAATGAAHTAHQFIATQFGKQLLQIGKRDILPA